MNKKIILTIPLAFALGLFGCGDDSDDGDTTDGGTMTQDGGGGSQDAGGGNDDASGGNPDAGQTDAGNTTPTKPTLGSLIDRAGRPAISTALVGTFTDTTTASKDAYNITEPANWAGTADDIAANLAIYDALDGTCGNQLLAGSTVAADRYAVLAGALADDQLYVNSASGTCTQYFGVELDATGIAANTDCGGRAPSYDVINVTYSALAIGAVSGVSDGVDADDASQSDTDFPFLAAP